METHEKALLETSMAATAQWGLTLSRSPMLPKGL